MGNLSFHAKECFIGNYHGHCFDDDHLMRLSSQIRGEQIANYIGAKYNAKEWDENDLHIYIKPRYIQNVRSQDWLDMADDYEILPKLKERPDIRIIAAAQYGYDWLRNNYPNQVILIPQQHINWDNEKRDSDEMKVAGYIGTPSQVAFGIYDKLGDKLQDIGVDFITCYNFKTRQDAVDFYKSIDLLVISAFELENEGLTFATPTKLINAASFGIPTIAKRLRGYIEWEGNYIAVSSDEELLAEVEKMKDKEYYRMWSEKVRKAAERYHISRIAELYKSLL